MIMIKHIDNVKYNEQLDKIILHTKDMRGKPEAFNVLDFSTERLYNLIIEAYELGRKDKAEEIKRVLK